MEERRAGVRRSRAWLAGLLTVLTPGLGQLYAGRGRRALLVYGLCVLAGLAAFAIVAYGPAGRAALIAALVIYLGACVAALVDAAVVARRPAAGRRWYQSAWALVGAVVLAWLGAQALALGIRSAWLEAFVVPTGGMADTLLPGDRVLADHTWYRFRAIERGDVVTFRRVAEDGSAVVLIQRVVALPGETVEVRDEVVWIDGAALAEPYAVYRGSTVPEMVNTAPTVVPPGYVFLLGDERRRSFDSRFTGPVAISDITGRALKIYWSSVPPPERRRWVRPPGASSGPAPGEVRWERLGRAVR